MIELWLVVVCVDGQKSIHKANAFTEARARKLARELCVQGEAAEAISIRIDATIVINSQASSFCLISCEQPISA